MGANYSDTSEDQGTLLSAKDPVPFIVTPGENLAFLVVCDHAGHHIPGRLGDLGMAERDRLDHIGWDPGAVEIARRVAARLRAPLVEGVYSRLVVDCNRYPEADDAVPEVSDHRAVPVNIGLSPADRQARIREIFVPYHQAIDACLERAIAAGKTPVLLSIHSCAPAMDGTPRPWEIGVGWTRDERLSAPLLAALIARGDLVVGDNEPYGLDIGLDFTTPEHAMTRGLPHLQLEFRQDLLTSQGACERWADVLVDALQTIMTNGAPRSSKCHITAADGLTGFTGWLSRFSA